MNDLPEKKPNQPEELRKLTPLQERFARIAEKHAKGPSKITVEQAEAFMLSSVVDQLAID